MKPETISLIHKTSTGFLSTALLIGAVFSPLPFSILAVALLILNAYMLLNPGKPHLKLATTFSTAMLTPITLETMLPPYAAGLASTLVLPLLTGALVETPLKPPREVRGRGLTVQAKTLISASTAFIAVSTILNDLSAALGAAVTLTLLISLIIYSLCRIPGEPFELSKQTLRVLAGGQAETAVQLQAKTGVSTRVEIFCVEKWIQVHPLTFSVQAREAVTVNVKVRPTLACPETVKAQLIVVDNWGLTATGQVLELFELHVIPKARYAEWLARRYIEGSLRSIGFTLTTRVRLRAPRGGVEFHRCRLYTPGDNPRSIDWKHTCKLQRLVVKEYSGGYGRPSVIAGNMTAQTMEEADETLYNLISSAYTMAREATPIALAVYNREKVLTATQPLNPGEALKRLLRLTASITVQESAKRLLQPPQIDRLRRLIEVLKASGKAEQVLKLLELEYTALLHAAKTHPAGKALTLASERTPSPALLLLASNWSHDSEALAVKLKELEAKGYEIIQLPNSKTR